MAFTTIQTEDLTGPALDWAVAKWLGGEFHMRHYLGDNPGPAFPAIKWQHHWIELSEYSPSTDWERGGPIIEREGISTYLYGNAEWCAHLGGKEYRGPTPLIAAMRCYVATTLGHEVDIPEELIK